MCGWRQEQERGCHQQVERHAGEEERAAKEDGPDGDAREKREQDREDHCGREQDARGRSPVPGQRNKPKYGKRQQWPEGREVAHVGDLEQEAEDLVEPGGVDLRDPQVLREPLRLGQEAERERRPDQDDQGQDDQAVGERMPVPAQVTPDPDEAGSTKGHAEERPQIVQPADQPGTDHEPAHASLA